MTDDGSKTSHLSIESIGPELLRDSDLQLNLRQTIIVVTEDKALLCLKDHESQIGRAREWVAPASVLVAILLALLSADFKDTFGVSAAVWTAFFWLVALFAFVWLVTAVVRFRKRQTPEDIVRLLMAAGHVEQLGKPANGRPPTVEGTWTGHLLYGDERYGAELDLVQADAHVEGSLVVVDRAGEKFHQTVEGSIEKNWLTLEAEIDPDTGYHPDNLSVEIMGDTLKGGCGDSLGNTGIAEFKRK